MGALTGGQRRTTSSEPVKAWDTRYAAMLERHRAYYDRDILSGRDYILHPSYGSVDVKSNIKPKPTPLTLFYEEEDVEVSHEPRRFILSLPKLSPTVNSVKAAKRLGRGDNDRFSTENSEEHVLQKSTSLEIPLHGGTNEKDYTSLVDTFGRRTIANWKCRGGKGKEWRKAPWESASSVSRGFPETFLKRNSSFKNHRWFSGRQPETKKFDYFALKLYTAEAVAGLADVYRQWVIEEDEASWPQEEPYEAAKESGHIRLPNGPDHHWKSQDDASFSLPNDSYSGAIIGGHFRLDTLIEEHETPGERTYAVSELMVPERKLVARSYSLSGLPRACRDARKRHMKRLIRRENGCDVRQDGKIYIVYNCDGLPSPSASTQLSVHDRIQRGIRPSGPSKPLQDDTVFPPLSANASQTEPNTFWKPSKVQGFFKRQNKKAPPSRFGAADSLSPEQVSATKRKRHRWKKAKRTDPPEPCTAAASKELAALTIADGTSGEVAVSHPEMADPSFGGFTELDKHLQSDAEIILSMVAEVEECDLYAFRKSLEIGTWVPSTLRTQVIGGVVNTMPRQELWFGGQIARSQMVLRFMHRHFCTQKRLEEIHKLTDKAERMVRI